MEATQGQCEQLPSNWLHNEMETPEPKQTDDSSLPPVKIRRGTFAELTLHEVADYELERLQRLAHESPDSLYLNFAIFLLSTSVSFFVALLTADVSTRVFTVFVVITTVGLLVGALLLILGLKKLIVWRKRRSSLSDLIREIRSRLPAAEGVQGISPTKSNDIERV